MAPYQPQEYQPQPPSQDHVPVALAVPNQAFNNGGLLLVPLRDQTVGQGSGTDYISILTNYLNQWIGSKPSNKPEKPSVGEKPTTEGGEY